MKQSHISKQRGERKNGAKIMFKETMPEIFPDLLKNIKKPRNMQAG